MLHHADAPPCLLAYGQSPRTLLSCCRTDVFDDCAAPRLLVDIVKLPLKPPPLCVACLPHGIPEVHEEVGVACLERACKLKISQVQTNGATDVQNCILL